ncbi:major histocompatibility complex class I-related gene protein-like isoform X1 [Synchiropus splendidus]|uniref:major histocompatibility complex class I-related gene protein-like isoform X1 n=1 Tax=Synchiropus splendidus TaxID=270530 RepID=UPI00237DD151|nr:major histocompatibility complex class I-related gene protein-like isoform X1 [Synchiropus splendidus]XP_053722757.1 major histocompatibility complex class I-related gene protein-like isoform X1 [Synchiropus splendidus]XP_053722758.1 major histocompatibility complex class I-related gene protein-like isoform X1 [Synchiropus splendidus]
MMGLVLILPLFGINSANAVFHSLKFIRTASSGVQNVPEFMEVGLVDDVLFSHYDSNSSRVKPKQDWMIRLTEDDPEYLESETQRCKNDQWASKKSMREVQERFNQTGGVHILQVMSSCEWDDETGEVRCHHQCTYDGEDFLSLDLKTLTWNASTPQAVDTKHQWDNNESYNKYLRYYLKTQCPERLKKLLHYGNSSLLRPELPSVSLLQKTPSSPIVCHATWFYPPQAKLFWTKDGEELHKDVDIGEVLPNPDGTFQMMAELKLPDPSEAWERFTCVLQLHGAKKVSKKLDQRAFLTNSSNTTEEVLNPLKPPTEAPPHGKPEDQTVPIAVSVAAVVVVLLITAAAVIGVVMRRRAGQSTETDTNISEGHTLALNPLTEAPAHDVLDMSPSDPLVEPQSEAT